MHCRSEATETKALCKNKLPDSQADARIPGFRWVFQHYQPAVTGQVIFAQRLSCGYGKTFANRISRRDLPRDVSGQWETGLDPGKPDGPAKPVHGRRPLYLKPETGLDPAKAF